MRESLKNNFEEILYYDKEKLDLTSLLTAIFQECFKKFVKVQFILNVFKMKKTKLHHLKTN